MKLLIIGGTGVISTAITHEAIRLGFNVSLLNRGRRKNLLPDTVELLKCDISNEEAVKQLLRTKHYDCIIDCLCYTLRDLKRNLRILSDRTDQYIFISSCAVYNTKDYKNCTEDTPKPLRQWKYSVNKWECEKYLVYFAKSNCLNYTIVRPSVTYGDTRIPYGISPRKDYHYTLIERIKNHKPIILWNSGKNISNIMHVDDFARKIVGIVGNEKTYNQPYNICSNKCYSWEEVISTIEKIIGHKAIRLYISSKEYASCLSGSRKYELLGGRAIDAINSNCKIRQLLPEVEEEISLEEGIKRTISFYEQNNYLKGIDYEFDGECDAVVKKYGNRLNGDFQSGFMDYLGNATPKEKRIYKLNSMRFNIIGDLLYIITKVINKLLEKIYNERSFKKNS